MGISVALALAAAGVAGLPAQVVIVPLAADPVLAQARLVRPVIVWAFAAPTAPPDIRHFATVPVVTTAASVRPDRRRLVATTPTTAIEDEPRLDALVLNDSQSQITGRRVRRSSMAAGLSFRVVQADGALAPVLGMSGPVGKALTRIAVEATEPR